MAKTKRQRKPSTQQAQVVAIGTPIRFEKAKSARKPKPSAADVAVVVAHEINPVTGFSDFLREYAVVGLAIGFIVGLQAQGLVKSLVDSFINPIFQLLFGQRLQDHVITIHFRNHDPQNLTWGVFVYTLMNFLFVLASIYIVVKVFKLDRLEKPSKADIAKMKAKH